MAINFKNNSTKFKKGKRSGSKWTKNKMVVVGRGKTIRLGSTSKKSLNEAKPGSQKADRTGAISAMNLGLPISDQGLWACETIEAVEMLMSEWAATFRTKATNAVKSKRKSYPDICAKLDALFTQPDATSACHMLFEHLLVTAGKTVRDYFTKTVEENSRLELAFVTIIDGRDNTSHSKTEIDLYNAQKRARASLRAISSNFFAISEISLFNSTTLPEGGQHVQLHTHALVVGEGVVAKANSVARKHDARFIPNLTGARAIDVKSVIGSPVNIARVVAYMFKQPHKCLNWNPGKNGKKGHLNHSEAGDRFVRYLRLAQVRSMLTIDQVTFASGGALGLRSDLIKFLRAEAYKNVSIGRPILHPDAIASFWVEVVSMLKKNWNLPIIKTRK